MVLRAVLRFTSLDNDFFGFFGRGRLLLVLTKPTPFADVAAAEFFRKNEKLGRPQFFATFTFRTYIRSLGSSRSATELRPLVASDCAPGINFPYAV